MMAGGRFVVRKRLLALALAVLCFACSTTSVARAQPTPPPACIKNTASGLCYPNQAYVAKYLVPKMPLTAEDRLWQRRIEAASTCSQQVTKDACQQHTRGDAHAMCRWDEERGLCSGGMMDTLQLFRDFSCAGSKMAKAFSCLVHGVTGKCPPTKPARCFWKNMEALGGRIELRCIDKSVDSFSSIDKWWGSLRAAASQPEQWQQLFGSCVKATALMRHLQCDSAISAEACRQLPHCQGSCHLKSPNSDVQGLSLADLWLKCTVQDGCSV